VNGPTDALPEQKSVLFDTNWVINFVKDKVDGQMFEGTLRYVSVITRIELYGFPGITPEETEKITRFLEDVTVVPLNNEVEQETIAIRRKFRPKLPDAIIAATALALGATLITGDGPLAKNGISGLQIFLAP
jgi:predicted nucleic acid-binding protein